jgi:hypothetical protein
MAQTISSTQYRFSYQIGSDDDIPVDFLIPNQDLHFESAVFLPQDYASAPQRESSHPPRIFFLMRDCLKVYTHPIFLQFRGCSHRESLFAGTAMHLVTVRHFG